MNQGEDGEKADGGVTTIKAYGTTLTLTEKDDPEIKVETIGNTIFDITEDTIEFSTDAEIKRTIKKALTLETQDALTLTAQKDVGLKSSGSGKLELGNTVATLGAMINDLLGYLASLKTVGSPASHTASPDFIAQIQALKAKWGQVFK